MPSPFAPPPYHPFEWPEQIQVGGEWVPCQKSPWHLGGVTSVIVTPGLPPWARQRVLEASQLSTAAFGWRVNHDRSLLPHELTAEVMREAERLLEADLAATSPRLTTLLVEKQGEIVVAGTVCGRDRISPQVTSRWWAVGSRLIIHPDLRGAGLGQLLIAKFEETALNLFGRPMLGYFYPTNNPQMVAFLKTRRAAGSQIICVGAKTFRDELVTVHLVFLPGRHHWLREQLSALAASARGPWSTLAAMMERVLQSSLSPEQGPGLRAAWREAQRVRAHDEPRVELLDDALRSFEAFGLFDVPPDHWARFDRALTLPDAL